MNPATNPVPAIATHTPGPWNYALHRPTTARGMPAGDPHFRLWNTTEGGFPPRHIGTVTLDPTKGYNDKAQGEANARLIAAAPDLLAALGNLLSFCEKGYHDNTILTEARAAIARATT